MAEYPPDTTNIPLPIYGKKENPAVDSLGDEKKANVTEHLETTPGVELDETTDNLHRSAAIAIIQQQHTIPATGKRMPTSKWEYIFFCIFCEYSIHNCTRAKLIDAHQISRTTVLVSWK
jgi:hypothetical protein